MPWLTSETDADWWNNLKNDDPSALGHLYDAYVDKLFISAMYITDDRELAKDALQEVFIEIWQYRKTLGDIGNSKAYLTKILSRIIYKKLRTARLFIADEHFDVLSQDENAEEKLITSDVAMEKRKKLNTALSKLTKRQKLILDLSFNQRLTYQQIADRLEMNYQSVNNLIFRTLRRLREVLTPVIISCFLLF